MPFTEKETLEEEQIGVMNSSSQDMDNLKCQSDIHVAKPGDSWLNITDKDESMERN